MTGQNNGRRVIVIGAGVAGLTAALALARQGAQVQVLEQAAALTQVGAGVQIAPNGMCVLHRLGVTPRGAALEAVELRSGTTGARISRMSIGSMAYDAPWCAVHRADLIDTLAQAVWDAGVDLCLRAQVTKVTADSVEWGGQTQRPDLIIAADGLRSRAARDLGLTAPAQFTGQVAWRMMVPLQPGAPNVARVYVMPGRHIVTYPLAAQNALNVVAVEERETWQEEGWSLPGNLSSFRSRFSALCPEVLDQLSAADQVIVWGLFKRDIPMVWHQGCAGLIGDAVHPTLPFMAQGANLAIEDAWCLAQTLDRCSDVGQGWQAFTQARIDRVRRVVGLSDRNARLYHLGGLFRPAAHLGLRIVNRIMPQAPLRSLNWLYRWQPGP